VISTVATTVLGVEWLFSETESEMPEGERNKNSKTFAKWSFRVKEGMMRLVPWLQHDREKRRDTLAITTPFFQSPISSPQRRRDSGFPGAGWGNGAKQLYSTDKNLEYPAWLSF